MSQHKKPREDFPLSPIGNGQWRKVVNGKPYYFGSWHTDPKGEAALKEWLGRKDAILAGLDHVASKASTESGDGLTVPKLVRQYLTIRSADVETHKLASDTFRDYAAELNAFIAFTGDAKAAALAPSTFAAYRKKLDARKLGPHAMKRVLACVKVAFNYAMDEEWIPPIRFGRSFAAPSTDDNTLSQHRLRAGTEDRTTLILGRKKIRRLLRTVKDKPEWRAFVLLMLNTAMNPAELARLKWKEVNFKSGRLHRKRWKTGILQEAYLWKRTRKALEALPRNGCEFIFVRADGRLWVDSKPVMLDQVVTKTKRFNFITRDFLPIVEAAKLPGVTPYTLRRTARTHASNCTDDNAAKRMMGQALTGRDTTYIKRPFPLKRLHTIAMTIYRRACKPKTAKAQNTP